MSGFDPNTIRSVISKVNFRAVELCSQGAALARDGRAILAEFNFAASDEMNRLSQDLEKIAERIERTGE